MFKPSQTLNQPQNQLFKHQQHTIRIQIVLKHQPNHILKKKKKKLKQKSKPICKSKHLRAETKASSPLNYFISSSLAFLYCLPLVSNTTSDSILNSTLTHSPSIPPSPLSSLTKFTSTLTITHPHL